MTVGLLANSLNVSSMTTDADVSKFFGGAGSAAELQTRVDANFDQYVDQKPTIFSFWNWFSTPKLASQGPVDAKLREVSASQAQTQAYIDALKKDPKISDAARSSALEELELRKKFLSQVGQCHDGLRDDLIQAKQTVAVNAGEIDRIAKIGVGGTVVDRDTKIARTVNDAMKAPFERAQTCYSRVVTRDPLAKAQADLGTEFVTGSADTYVESNRHVAQVSSELDQKDAQDKAVLRRKELAERCKLSGTSMDCLVDSGKLAASDARQWVTRGWDVLGDKVTVDLPEACGSARTTALGYSTKVLGYGTDWAAHPYQSYAVQGGKMAGGAALAVVGLYAAYKLTKLGWRGACALKNALWTNRSKKSRVAILMAIGAAVAVAPSVAMQYGLMQQ